MEDITSENEWELDDEVEQQAEELLTDRQIQEQRGFEFDEHGNIKAIGKLQAAVDWFKKNFREKNADKKIKYISVVGTIKGDFIQDYSRSYKDDEDGMAAFRKDVTKFNICFVLRVTFVSIFGSDDMRYYYIVFRRSFFKRWANTYYENARSFFNHDGITIKVDIVNHSLPPSLRGDIAGISTLVLVTGDTKIYYISMEDILKLAHTKLGVFTDKWNQVCVGIPRSAMSLEDLNKY